MEIKRQQELVEHYHYDIIPPDTTEETSIRVGLAPLDPPEDYPEGNTILGVRLEFNLIFQGFGISGTISQIDHLLNREVKVQEDLTRDEINELARPLFSILERITYEVTEIALDKPGLKINFLGSDDTSLTADDEAPEE